MFMHRDDDGKSQISKDQEKESIAAINSILHSVKQSQDAVDATKSKVGKKPFFDFPDPVNKFSQFPSPCFYLLCLF